MARKVTIVTGASSGIGAVTARELARDGFHVFMICRNREKGEAARQAMRDATGNDDVELIVADLGRQAEVHAAVEAFTRRSSRLDVLVNNAGAINLKRSTTADGIETTFAVNHLAPFLLTSLLLPVLKASTPARIVNVSSRAHFRTHMDFDDIEGKKHYEGWKTYSQSKLANVMFTYELARRLEGTGVTANCLHPGVIASGFGRNERTILNILVRIGKPFLMSPERGAKTILYLARAPEVEGVTGKYFDDDTSERRSSRASYDVEAQRRLWDLSERMTGVRVS